MLKLTKSELEDILTEVTKEYEEVKKSEMEKSAAPMAKEESSTKTEESSKAEPPKAKDPMPEGTQEPVVIVKAEGDAPPMEEAPAEEAGPAVEAAPEVAPEAAPEAEVASDDADMGHEELMQLYSSLTPEHLAMHWLAASQSLFQNMSSGQEGQLEEEVVTETAPEAPAVEAAPEAAPEEAPAFGKSEAFKTLQKNYDDLKNQNSTLEKSLGDMADKFSKFLGQPVIHGITADSAIYKAEEPTKQITKSEVQALLSEKAKDPKLTAADKQKVVEYSIQPSVTNDMMSFLGIK